MKVKDLKLGEMFTIRDGHHIWVKIEGNNILSLTTLHLSAFAQEDEIVSQGYIEQTTHTDDGLQKHKPGGKQ